MTFSQGDVIAVIGIIVTIIIAVFFGKAIYKKISVSQKQKVSKGSFAIQSGRDTNIEK